jgi:hypothetical protein
VAFILLFAVAIGEAHGQTASNPEPKTLAEMASAAAHSIDAVANAHMIPNAPIVFQSATSHHNFVEVHYTARDAQFFPHNTIEGERRRLQLAHYLCPLQKPCFRTFNRPTALAPAPAQALNPTPHLPGIAPPIYAHHEARFATERRLDDTHRAGLCPAPVSDEGDLFRAQAQAYILARRRGGRMHETII